VFRSSMRSSSGSFLFISLSMLLILKIIKIFKNYYQSIVVMWQHMFSMPVTRTVWRRELDSSSRLHTVLFKYFNNFNISNIDKEINKELPEDDLIEDRNTLMCFLKCFK
jgi:hypothetical protein